MKPIYAILAGAAIPSTFILGWMLLDTACTPETAATANESIRECYRGWLGASSGWAAAFVGGVTILILFLQVRKTEEAAYRRHEEARQVFDDEFTETLKAINNIWKHAEDILCSFRDDPRIHEYVILMSVRLKSLRASINEQKLRDLCSQMHPLDAYKRTKLIDKVADAVQPVTRPVVDAKKGSVRHLEVEGLDYFNFLVINFALMTYSLDTVSESFSGIFSHRDTRGLDEFMATDEENFKEYLFQEFPSDPKNPY